MIRWQGKRGGGARRSGRAEIARVNDDFISLIERENGLKNEESVPGLAFTEPLRDGGVFETRRVISINVCVNHTSSAARLNGPQLTS